MTERRLSFTRHAETMLAERAIERDWIERTIREPDELGPDPSRANVVQAYKSIPERGGRMLRVVYSTSGGQIRVITAFFDRAKRR